MIRNPNKKILFFIKGLIAWSLSLSPLTSLAEKIQYTKLEGTAFQNFPASASNGELGGFLTQAFSFGLALAAALTVIMIVWGGLEIMLSESVFKKEDGKKKIQEAILGLGLALVSWLILYIINPDILNFRL